jgi:hypothetical protein
MKVLWQDSQKTVDLCDFFHYHTAMVFYSDTNGQLPEFRSTALIMLGIVMDCTPLDEIDFEEFKKVSADLDNFS